MGMLDPITDIEVVAAGEASQNVAREARLGSVADQRGLNSSPSCGTIVDGSTALFAKRGAIDPIAGSSPGAGGACSP
jgi:hypothetical protein